MNLYHFSVPVSFTYSIEAETEEKAKKILTEKQGKNKMKDVTYVEIEKEDYEKANMFKISFYNPFTH